MKAERPILEPSRPARALGFLVCDMAGEDRRGTLDEAWAVSPLQCLRRVEEEGPRIVLVRFGPMSLRQRAALVELCAAIHRQPLHGDRILVALLHARHRALLVDLQRAGVDYIRYGGRERLDPRRVQELLEGLAPEDRIGQRLGALCPYLHYKPIDSRHELTVCGAYRDRMVLGGHRLADICQDDPHLACEYFLDPRGPA